MTLNRLFTEDNPRFQAAVQEILWGGQPAVHGIEPRFFSAPSAIDNNIQIRLEVTYPVPALNKTQVAVVEHYVTQYDLRLEQVADIALQVLQNLVRQVAPKLFEIDPRIGVTVSPQLPRYPLFDPTHMGQLLQSAHFMDQVLQGSPESLSYLKSGEPGTSCPFCEAAFLVEDKDSEIAWGGGNLGWVHRKCHPILKQPTAHAIPTMTAHGVTDGEIKTNFKHPARNYRADIGSGLPSEPFFGYIYPDPRTGVTRIYTEDGWRVCDIPTPAE